MVIPFPSVPFRSGSRTAWTARHMQAKAILALETQIAKRHWPVEKRRERELTYNLRTREQLDAMRTRDTLTMKGVFSPQGRMLAINAQGQRVSTAAESSAA